MSLQLLVSSKSIDQSRFLTKWQNIVTLVVLFLMPIQRHFRLRIFEDPVLSHQHSYNTLFYSLITPLIALWLTLQLMRFMTLKRAEMQKVAISIVPILLICFCLGEHKVLGYFHLYRMLELALLLAMFWRWIESAGVERVRNAFFKSAFVMGLFESVVVLLQFFSGKQVGLRILGETRFDVHKLGCANILEISTSFANAVAILHYPSQFIRAPGTTPHPNIMGGILAIYLLMVFSSEVSRYHNAIKNGSPIQKWRLPLVVALFFTALIVTFSRSALFGFGIGFVFVGGWVIIQRMISKRLLILLGAILLFLSPFILARGGILFNSNSIIKACNEERLRMMMTSFKMFMTSPLTGVGAGEYVAALEKTFAHFELSHQTEILYQPVHNVICLILAEMGILGVASLVVLLRRYFLFKWPRTLFEWGALGALMALLFIANCDHYLLSFPEGRVLTAIVFSWYALEFHFSRLTVFESSRPK